MMRERMDVNAAPCMLAGISPSLAGLLPIPGAATTDMWLCPREACLTDQPVVGQFGNGVGE